MIVRCPACGAAYDGRQGEDGLEGYDPAEGVWTTDCAQCGAPNLEPDEIALDLLAERKSGWTGADLKCAREALGLSTHQLAAWLPWKQSRVSECEHDRRKVPEWVAERIRWLECARDDLADKMLEALENSPETVLIVHQTDASYQSIHSGEPVPAVVQRIAAAIAAAEWEADKGERPSIVFAKEAA